MADESDSPTKGLSADTRQYFEALGYFLTIFSLIEATTQNTLWHFTGLNAPIAPAIFSGTRTEAAGGHIKRIAEATNWPPDRKSTFDELARQLGEITRTRNDLLHFGPQGEGDEMFTTNKMLAHIDERIRQTKISAKILNNMSRDLLMISSQLAVLTGHINAAAFPLLPEGALKLVWKYKPERQSGRG